MQRNSGMRPLAQAASNPNVTSAIGLEETVGRRRARRYSLFTQTVLWVTGLFCTALLLGSLAQAWSNSQLMGQVQHEQQKLQATEQQNATLKDKVRHYKDQAVIENEARQKLGYIRPGEHPVVIVSAGDQETTRQSSKGTSPVQQNFWQEWWDTFFGG